MKTIIDRKTGEELYGTMLDFEDTDNEVAVDEVRQTYSVKPYFDFDKREYYEGATEEEIKNSIEE